MSKAVIVVGMHRSMTSGVAQGLHRAGIFMGDDMGTTQTKTQPRGHWEDRAFNRINMAILKDAGGDWKNPPERSAIIEAARPFAPAIGKLVARREEHHALWGWKDPRNSLILPVYLQFVPRDTHIVAVFRRPEQVALSLQRRDGFEIERGMALAKTYNDRIFEEVRLFLDGDQ